MRARRSLARALARLHKEAHPAGPTGRALPTLITLEVSDGYAIIRLMSDGQTGWTDEDDALLTYESLPEWHPALLVDVFRTGLAAVEPAANALLAGAFVTPESVDSWGDFSRARAIFTTGLKISTTALYGVDAPDVAYVRLVETNQHLNHDIDAVPATMHVTLVW